MVFKIAIIMSTYNGERYLPEQLDSICQQAGVDIQIFIRDDGSSDKTIEIINDYRKRYNNITFYNKNIQNNLGVKGSFLELLKNVLISTPEVSLFAFSDQDDVWKKDKLNAAITEIMKSGYIESQPTLYYSNKTFVDHNLNLLAEENIRYYGDFYETFYNSLVSGCTMVFNRKMAEIAVGKMPSDIFLHDSWIYRLAKSCDANIVFDSNSYILYRQHDHNVRGINSCKPAHYDIRNLFRKREHPIQCQFKEIFSYAYDNIGNTQRKYIEKIIVYDHNFIAKISLIFDRQAVKRGLFSFVVWSIKLIFNIL